MFHGTLSVAVVIRLERTIERNTQVLGLILAQLSQFDAQFVQVQTCNLLIESLRQNVETDLKVLKLHIE
jgi:hypothetical protein